MDPFRDLCIRDAFGRSSQEERADLRSDRQVETFLAELRAVSAEVGVQLEEREGDADWRRRTVRLKSRVDARASELVPLVGALRRRSMSGQVGALVTAIKRHREANICPTPYDRDLYEVMEEVRL